MQILHVSAHKNKPFLYTFRTLKWQIGPSRIMENSMTAIPTSFLMYGILSIYTHVP